MTRHSLDTPTDRADARRPGSALDLLADAPLATRTTLGVGGPARRLVRCESEDALRAALSFAREEGLDTFLLGGGSNLLVADAGFDGLVIEVTDGFLSVEDRGDFAIVRAGAGLGWDDLVACAVDAGLAGIECLSGIPGRVGAAPMQNIGAYGQEVAETISNVRVVERRTGSVRDLAAAHCGFAYRSSRFKTTWRDRFAVSRVDFHLPRRATGSARYPELRRRLGLAESPTTGEATPSLATLRRAVLEIRREKSMVIDPDDPNHRSAGSFFTNPIVEAARADEIAAATGELSMPRWPTGREGDRVKLSAAWLIEHAGFSRGWGEGRAGLSTRHTLAIVNRGEATAADIVAVAAAVRRGVREAFGVTLEPEPTFLGFDRPVEELLDG